MPSAMAIQRMTHRRAGMPVAFAMFKASVGTVGANGDERKKAVLRSSSAFKTHWTARKLVKKAATRALANFATAISPAERRTPAKRVKGMPERAPHDTIGLKRP